VFAAPANGAKTTPSGFNGGGGGCCGGGGCGCH
jgi:hypothetical protein